MIAVNDEAVSPVMWVVFFGFQGGEDRFQVAHKVFFIKLHCQSEEYTAKLFGS